MCDVRLLLWLRVRHARWTVNRALHLVGAGIDDGGWSERAYQLYAVGIMLVWFVLMVAALVDAVQGVFAGAGIALCALAVQAALIMPAIVLAASGIAGVRTSPLKLSHPDIAYLAASAVSARALVGAAVGVQVLGAAPAGGAVGFLLALRWKARACSRCRRSRWRSRARRLRLPRWRSAGSQAPSGWQARAGAG